MAEDEAGDWRDQSYWQALAAAQLSGSQDHDRAILTLGSGTLALSATFLHDIAPDPVGNSLILLLISWALLVVAIVLIVCSFQTSQWAMQAGMENRDEAMKFRTRVTIALNVASDIGFVGGIALFALFAVVNL